MILLYAFFFAVIIVIIILFVTTLRGFFREEKEFECYLYSIKDTETLYNLGIINKSGMRERRQTRFYEVEGKLLEKFNLTGDKKYKEYFYARIAYRKKLIFLFILPFFVMVIFFITKDIIL